MFRNLLRAAQAKLTISGFLIVLRIEQAVERAETRRIEKHRARSNALYGEHTEGVFTYRFGK